MFVKDFVIDDEYAMRTHNEGILVNGSLPSWNMMINYNNDLTNAKYKELDIMVVEIANHPYAFTNIQYNKSYRKLVWKRKEPKKMTVAEIEAILGYKVEIVSEVKYK